MGNVNKWTTIYTGVLHLAGLAAVATLVGTGHLDSSIGAPLLAGLVGLGIGAGTQLPTSTSTTSTAAPTPQPLIRSAPVGPVTSVRTATPNAMPAGGTPGPSGNTTS